MHCEFVDFNDFNDWFNLFEFERDHAVSCFGCKKCFKLCTVKRWFDSYTILFTEGAIRYDDHCRVCHRVGDLLCCETCNATFHLGMTIMVQICLFALTIASIKLAVFLVLTLLSLLEKTTLTWEKLIKIGDVWKALRKIFHLSCVWNLWLKRLRN